MLRVQISNVSAVAASACLDLFSCFSVLYTATPQHTVEKMKKPSETQKMSEVKGSSCISLARSSASVLAMKHE